MNRIHTEKIKNILHIRLDKLGDLILSTPLLNTIRKNLPSARITCVVSPYTGSAMAAIGLAHRIMEYDPAWPVSRKLNFALGLKSEKFDLALAHSPHIESYALACLSGARYRLGNVYRERPISLAMARFMLTHPNIMNIRERLSSGQSIPHEVEQGLELAKIMGIQDIHKKINFKPGESALDKASVLLERWGWTGSPTVCIHLSQNWRKAGWENPDFRELCIRLSAEDYGFKVLFTSGPGEMDMGEDLRSFLGEGERIRFASGLSVSEWAGILSLCVCLISTDTGAVHLSSAVNTPVVVLYDPDCFELNSRQWYPWQVRHKIMAFSGIPAGMTKTIVQAIEEIRKEFDGAG